MNASNAIALMPSVPAMVVTIDSVPVIRRVTLVCSLSKGEIASNVEHDAIVTTVDERNTDQVVISNRRFVTYSATPRNTAAHMLATTRRMLPTADVSLVFA